MAIQMRQSLRLIRPPHIGRQIGLIPPHARPFRPHPIAHGHYGSQRLQSTKSQYAQDTKFSPAGTAIKPSTNDSPCPLLFQPLKLRNVTLHNRIMLSPMCQYSADQNGHFNHWHLAHLGSILARSGPGLTMIEATAVEPRGRTTPADTGLWNDSQAESLRPIVEFAHSQGQNIGLQLAHAGRKASTVEPWLKPTVLATPEVGGWPDDVVGPSAIPWSDRHAPVRVLSLDEIRTIKSNFINSARRAVDIGIDVIELHAAHGYLLHSFLSPISNNRTDCYGGDSFESRSRLLLELVEDIRGVMPSTMPLFVRVSATEWLESALPETPSWRLKDTVRLAPMLAERGVDLLDVSSGGGHPMQKVSAGQAYQAPFAKAIKAAVGDKMAVSTVGMLGSAKVAQQALDDGLDLAVVGRGFLRDPALVWTWAEQLDVKIHLAKQIGWAFP